MGQINLIRTQFIPRSTVTTPASSAVQEVDFLGYFEVGDTVEIIETDPCGNVLSTIASGVTVSALDQENSSVILDTSVDTTGLTGTPQIRVTNIDDGQAAIDRLYRKTFPAENVGFAISKVVVDEDLDTPVVGQGTYYVDDVSFVRVGDTVSVISDSGVAGTATVLAVDPNADDVNNKSSIVLDSSIDTSLLTNPVIVVEGITAQDAIERNKEDIDKIDSPIENEYIGVGDCLSAFYTSDLFLSGSLKPHLDGVRKLRGTAGTRATLSQGASNSELIFTSLILGTDGNDTEIEVASGSGLTVVVDGSYNAGYTITVNDNGGAATAQDIADAINADATARRIVQAQYGGDGSGTVSAFGPTALSGGLDDGTGDFAEIEQVLNNEISNTGYKIFAFHIRPSERNRMNAAPQDDEEIWVDYRKALDNA